LLPLESRGDEAPVFRPDAFLALLSFFFPEKPATLTKDAKKARYRYLAPSGD
jgi:hypothetical protein